MASFRLIDHFNCLTGGILWAVCLGLAVLLIVKFIQTRKNSVLETAVVFFSLGIVWGVLFVQYIFTIFDNPMSARSYCIIQSSALLVVTWTWSHVISRRIGPRIEAFATSAVIIIGSIDLIWLVTLGDEAVVTNEPSSGDLISGSQAASQSYLLFICLATTLLVVTPVFLRTSFQSKEPLTCFRARSIGIGTFLLFLGGVSWAGSIVHCQVHTDWQEQRLGDCCGLLFSWNSLGGWPACSLSHVIKSYRTLIGDCCGLLFSWNSLGGWPACSLSHVIKSYRTLIGERCGLLHDPHLSGGSAA